MWYLNRVSSAKALERLLREDPVFGEYEIIIAAGDGKPEDVEDEGITEKALERVRRAIRKENSKTITLTVGQLTVGVTVPEWTGILMLNTLKSPAAYLQAAFRVQNPHKKTVGDTVWMKEVAYVFDFDPARTLEMFAAFANELIPDVTLGGGDNDPPSERQKKRITKLLNFFPVVGEDEDGEMVELDVEQVLSIPRRLKCQDVVRQGFMSNFLFKDLTDIFRHPEIFERMIQQMPVAPTFNSVEERPLEDISAVEVDEDGNAKVPPELVVGRHADLFGKKIYGELEDSTKIKETPEEEPKSFVDAYVKQVTDTVVRTVVTPATQGANLTKRAQNTIVSTVEEGARKATQGVVQNYDFQKTNAEAEHQKALEQATTEEARADLEAQHQQHLDELETNFKTELEEAAKAFVKEQPMAVIRQVEQAKADAQKTSTENDIREHLRGFARTIPSFIMAYGDKDLRLDNFDQYTDPDVFQEVAGITMDDFRLLRDGGTVPNPVTGEPEKVEGHYFDEQVFNDSILEFLKKRSDLGNYFEEGEEGDIFNYIPPQKTNQIFTPKAVVRQMVEALEQENPGCFDDPEKTFADLYMKSGLYLAEIGKRLYRSEKMKQHFPDDAARREHILCHQLYGMAPTQIIFLIAKRYLLGFEGAPDVGFCHLVCADAAYAAKMGTLQELVDQHFGK